MCGNNNNKKQSLSLPLDTFDKKRDLKDGEYFIQRREYFQDYVSAYIIPDRSGRKLLESRGGKAWGGVTRYTGLCVGMSALNSSDLIPSFRGRSLNKLRGDWGASHFSKC